MLVGEEVEVDGETYSVSISLFKEMRFDDPSASRFFRTFLNQIFSKSGLVKLQNSRHYVPESWFELDGVNAYYAYYNTLKWVDGEIYLNLNPMIKFFQQETVLEVINRYNDERRVNEDLRGKYIMTVYDNKIYKIDEIIFTKNWDSTFFWDKSKKKISHTEYIKINYKLEVNSKKQPLVRYYDRHSNRNIYFIPQFCVLTGIICICRNKNYTIIMGLQ